MITLRMSEQDKITIENYASIKGMTVSDLMRNAVFEKIEDEIDLNLYNQAMKEYNKKPQNVVTFKEALHELGINE